MIQLHRKSFTIAACFGVGVTSLLASTPTQDLAQSTSVSTPTITATVTTNTRPVMVQVSTFDYFASGHYDGFVPMTELQQYGDFGLGTFDRVDGEMVEVDGNVYQVQADGKPHLASKAALTPFANVTFWKLAPTIAVKSGLTIAQLESQIDQTAPDQNIFVAIRVEGDFQTLKLRSEEPATKPYPLLTDFLKGQIIFNFKDIRGTLVGIRSPAFSKGLNVVGYHFHFISDDRQAGGHVLDLTTGNATLAINNDPLWELVLPTGTFPAGTSTFIAPTPVATAAIATP